MAKANGRQHIAAAILDFDARRHPIESDKFFFGNSMFHRIVGRVYASAYTIYTETYTSNGIFETFGWHLGWA